MSTVGIVTGAGRGMGYACAQRVAAVVDALLLVDRDAATANAARDVLSADHPGVPVESVELDIADAEGWRVWPNGPASSASCARWPTPPESPRPWPNGDVSSPST